MYKNKFLTKLVQSFFVLMLMLSMVVSSNGFVSKAATTDTKKPVVTLTDANGNVVKNKDVINVEVNSDFDLDKAISGKANDDVDGELPVTRGKFIRFGTTVTAANSGDNAGKVDVSKLGYYLAKYQAVDKAGNLTTVCVYFHVVDTTKPNVQMSYNGESLKSGDMIQVEAGSDFSLKDIQVVSTDNGMITSEGWSEKTIRYSQNLEDVGTAGFSAIDTNKQGYYLAKYVASDNAVDNEGNTKPNSRYVGLYIHVIDTIKPVINGIENGKIYDTDVTYSIDEKFLDYVVINGTKYYGEDIPYTISEDGTYTIKAVDTAGNESEEYHFEINKVKFNYTIEYSTTDYTYDTVTVTIKTNEPAKISSKGWTVDETGTIFTKTFNKNSSEDVVLTSNSGKTLEVNIKIENIVNKNNLETFVNKCSTLDSSKYSEASWNAYYPVYQAAVEMLSQPQSQDAVDNMYEDLIRAYLNLRLIPNGDIVKK